MIISEELCWSHFVLFYCRRDWVYLRQEHFILSVQGNAIGMWLIAHLSAVIRKNAFYHYYNVGLRFLEIQASHRQYSNQVSWFSLFRSWSAVSPSYNRKNRKVSCAATLSAGKLNAGRRTMSQYSSESEMILFCSYFGRRLATRTEEDVQEAVNL